MHCDRKDISKWNKTKKLKRVSQAADAKRKVQPLVNPKPLDEHKKFIRVIKKDGTVRLIDKTQ
jgi:hypothetical protein